MTIEQRLAEIKARCEMATSGPWTMAGEPNFMIWGADNNLISKMVLTGKSGKPWGKRNRQQIFEDLCFIRAARTDLPALVAALEVAVEMIHRSGDCYAPGDCDHCRKIRRIKEALRG